MCKVHNKVWGKKAVLAFRDALHGEDDICGPRMKYLRSTVKSFQEWLDKKGKNGASFVKNILEHGEFANCGSVESSPYYHSDSGRMMPYPVYVPVSERF